MRSLNGRFWEFGSVVVPVASWAALKQSFKQAFISEQLEFYRMALSIYDELVYEGYNRRRFRYDTVCVGKVFAAGYKDYWSTTQIYESMFRPSRRNGMPRKPAKRSFNFTPDLSSIVAGGTHIEFDNTRRVLRWTYSGSSPRASESKALSAIFEFLNQLDFPRGTGGICISGDASKSYGPLGLAMIGE